MKVLIFTASAGNGHNSTAKRIKEKLLENDPSTEIQTIDIYKTYATKLKAWTMEQGYFLLCNHFVSLYNYYFKKSENSSNEHRDKSKCNKEVYPIMYGMLKSIYDFKPDVIVTTYIFGAVALNNLRRFYSIPAKTICMCLDYGISPYWECCTLGLDYMCLTSESMVETFKEKGFKDSQLLVTGIPVSDKFNNLPSKEDSRKKLNLDPNMFTVVLTTQSFFPIKTKDIFKELAKIDKPIQIIVVNGKNEKRQKEIEKYITKSKLPHKFINLGFTDKIVEIFSASDILLGKAGGLFSTEQINSGLPGLIVDHLPIQEIYNKEYLISKGCAIGVSKDTIATNINTLIANPDKYMALRNATISIRKPNALEDICNLITSQPLADYSKIDFNDSKKQLIKNVDNRRKQAIINSTKSKG